MSGEADRLPVDQGVRDLAGEEGASLRAVLITVPGSRPRLTAEQQLAIRASFGEDFVEVVRLLKDTEPGAVLIHVKDIEGAACDWIYVIHIPESANERARSKWATSGGSIRSSMLPAKVRVLTIAKKEDLTKEVVTTRAIAWLEHQSKLELEAIPETNLGEFVIRKWQEYGDRVACKEGLTGEDVAYSQLLPRIRSCSAALQARGLQKGEVVAIAAPNSVNWIVAFLATLLGGGTVTTTNPQYGSAEVEQQLRHAKAVYLMTVGPMFPIAQVALAGYPVRGVFALDDAAGDGIVGLVPFSELLAADPSSLARVETSAHNDIAVLPYSSGTTGVPKGVMLTHYNLTADLQQVKSSGFVEVGIDDTIAAVLPFFHIYGMAIIMMNALMWGAKLIIMPKFDPTGFLDVLKSGVTLAYIAPPIVAFLAKHPAVEQYLPFPSLKDLVSASAPLGHDLATLCQKRLGIESLRQGYGMTELSSITHIVKYGSPKYSSIGVVIPGLTCKLVDPQSGEELDFGSQRPGEIWLRGPNIMKGYLENIKATAATVDEEGFLHTGDIAYMDAEGDFFIVDRLKELIKVKGFQVAPAELEDLLMQCDDIADAAVIGVAAAREGDGEAPKAFVVKKPDSSIDVDGVKKFIADRVIHYKRLAHVEFVETVPKSPAGKILRKELRLREGAALIK